MIEAGVAPGFTVLVGTAARTYRVTDVHGENPAGTPVITEVMPAALVFAFVIEIELFVVRLPSKLAEAIAPETAVPEFVFVAVLKL